MSNISKNELNHRRHGRAAFLRLGVLGLGLVILAGCQMQTADDDLPLPRMAPPLINTPAAPPPRPTAQLAAGIMTSVEKLPPKIAEAPKPRPTASASVPAAWIPSAPINHWTWIIVHHSDSDYGSAAIIDKWHRDRGFDELGYHFVIGNGTNSGDGQIEVGPRWTKQKWGAHDNALDNRYNTNGIGICLVGDFDKTRPTTAQMRSLLRLTEYLEKTYDISPDHVMGHGETKDTHCPGKYVDMAEIRRELSQELAADFPGRDEFAHR